MLESFNLPAAFIAGVLSFLSPCILPLLPGYLSFLTGFTLDEASGMDKQKYRLSALKGSIVFGAGFSIVFILLGATATAVGRILIQYQHILSVVMGIVVVILGLHMIGVFQIKFLYNEKKFHIQPKKQSKHRLLQAFFLGLAFAFGWTPCVGPILGGILTMAAQQENVRQGMILLSAYSLGLWLPFLAAALFTMPVLNALAKHPKIALRAQQVAGILLVVMGILLITGYMTKLSYLLA